MVTKNYTTTILGIALVVVLVGAYIYAQSISTQLSQVNTHLANAQTQINSLQSQVTNLQSQLAYSNVNVNRKIDDYQTKFHDRLQEHAFLLINTVRRSLDSSASFNASYDLLQRNINDVAAQIAIVYGNNTAAQFTALWNIKINNFVNYTSIVKGGDNTTANSTLAAAMANYEESSSAFWSNLNSYIDKATIKQLITDHVNNVKAAIDYWGARDYPNYFTKLQDSYNQIGIYADYIIVAIAKQHPEVFS